MQLNPTIKEEFNTEDEHEYSRDDKSQRTVES